MDIGDWSDDELRLFQEAIENVDPSIRDDVFNDPWVSTLYDVAMWDFEVAPDFRQAAYDEFVRYMEAEYGIEWDEIYDWEAYREAYDAATA